jgi:hypothetical protein
MNTVSGAKRAVRVHARARAAAHRRRDHVRSSGRTGRPRRHAGSAGHGDARGAPEHAAQRLIGDAQGLQHVVLVTASIASRSDTWMLTSTVRSSSLASIMRTGTADRHAAGAAASACSSSVWPGNGIRRRRPAPPCAAAPSPGRHSPRSAARAAQVTQSAARRPAGGADCAERHRQRRRIPPAAPACSAAAPPAPRRFEHGPPAGSHRPGRRRRGAPHGRHVARHKAAPAWPAARRGMPWR